LTTKARRDLSAPYALSFDLILRMFQFPLSGDMLLAACAQARPGHRKMTVNNK
jgi:hypothetical protein